MELLVDLAHYRSCCFNLNCRLNYCLIKSLKDIEYFKYFRLPF